MTLHSKEVAELHKEIHQGYKNRLEVLEKEDEEDEEREEPFERSFLHNAIYLHNLWFDQLEKSSSNNNKSPLLEEILAARESNISSFEEWLSKFALRAKPNGWAIWGWSYPLKTFVGFPIVAHDQCVPLGVTPILVIDCWEHSYQNDFGNDFKAYLDQFWRNLNYEVIESRHQELARLLGFNIR